MNDLRSLIRAADPHPAETPYTDEAVRRAVRTITAAEGFTPQGAGRNRRRSLFAGFALIAVAMGGATAVSASRPANDLPDPPLAPPIIVNGVGPAKVVVPDVPPNARYLHVEVACFDGPKCLTVGGGIEATDPVAWAASPPVTGTPEWPHNMARDAQPVTDEFDKRAAQDLPVLNPRSGVVVNVEPGTHWRLYAAYSGRTTPKKGENSTGETFGMPAWDWPDFVPVVATNGRPGYVSYSALLNQAQPRLTDTGAEQAPLPVVAFDGTTVVGEVDVSRPYR